MRLIASTVGALERRYAGVISEMRKPPGVREPPLHQVLRQELADIGIVNEGDESLIEMTARVLGTTPRELRA